MAFHESLIDTFYQAVFYSQYSQNLLISLIQSVIEAVASFVNFPKPNCKFPRILQFFKTFHWLVWWFCPVY